MKITNKLGLPEPFVQMCQSDYRYRPQRYSVTSLLKGIREAILDRRHEVELDVSDCIWMLFGTAAHTVLESHQEEDHQLKEISVEKEIDGITISGRFDLYDAKTKTVIDYKTCSVWKVIFGDYTDWYMQTLMYAYLLRESGFEADHGETVAIMRDHSKRDAKYKQDYPEYPVKRILFNFKAVDFEFIENWLKEKVEEIKRCEELPDDELPICTPEERFNSGDKFAVMAKGRKRALRVLDSLEDAEEWKKLNGGDYIETRKGEDKKCLEYCSVCKFCNYWQENYGGNINED
jgi:hypothetical protein